MTKFCWLIEAPGPHYLGVRKPQNDFHWTVDPNSALAFRSEEQADALLMAVRSLAGDAPGNKLFAFETPLHGAQAVEHGWLATMEAGDAP